VVRGLLRRNPALDVVRIWDAGLAGLDDPAVPIATAIEDLLLIAELSLPGEWEGQVRYLPLRWGDPGAGLISLPATWNGRRDAERPERRPGTRCNKVFRSAGVWGRLYL